jgi:hypothetical protein
MVKRILIAGRETSRQDMAERARALGYEPFPLDGRAGVKELQETFLTVGASGILAASAEAYPVVVEASALLGVPGPSARWLAPGAAGSLFQAMGGTGVPAVEHRIVAPADDAAMAGRSLGTPLRVCSGSIVGQPMCVVAEHLEDLPMAVKKARKRTADGPVLLKRTAAGPAFRVLGYKLHRHFLPLEIFAEVSQDGPYCVPMGYTLPSGLGGQAYKKAIDIAEQAAACLDPGVGLIELGLTADADHFQVLGISVLPLVCPVDAALMETAYGIDLQANMIRLVVGDAPVTAPRRELCAAARWIPASSGVLQEVQGVDEARQAGPFVQVHIAAKPGDVLGHVTDLSSRDATGYVLAAAPQRDQALDRLKAAMDTVQLVTKIALD